LLLDLVVKVIGGATVVRIIPVQLQILLELLKLKVDVVWILFRSAIRSLEHGREEALNDSSCDLRLLACVETALQNEYIRNGDEDLGVAALYLLLKLWVLFASALDQLTQADELLALVPRHQVRPP